jgi:hypothetical protein
MQGRIRYRIFWVWAKYASLHYPAIEIGANPNLSVGFTEFIWVSFRFNGGSHKMVGKDGIGPTLLVLQTSVQPVTLHSRNWRASVAVPKPLDYMIA